MKLNRQAIIRMKDDSGVNIGGRKTGGGGGGIGGGGVSSQWVEENYISKEFFNSLFTIHGLDANDNPITIDPNDTDKTFDSIEALVDFWSEGAISALGQGSGSGGGGATSLGQLSDVSLINPQNGQVLQYNDGQWINAAASRGTVTSVAMTVPAGFEVTGSPIDSSNPSGTLAVSFDGTITKNQVLATPAAEDGAPSWRALVEDDIPELPMSKITNLSTITFWGQTVDTSTTPYKVNGIMTFDSFALSSDYTDVWNDGTNDHPWYGYDHRYHNTGVYSTTISDYFGLTLKTGNVNLSMTSAGSVGIGTYDPYTTLHVNGGILATKMYLYKPNAANDTDAVYFIKDSTGVKLVGAGFYTDFFVTALGQGSGGGGGGATSLGQLTDVSLTSPQNGQVLKYNNGQWINAAASSGSVTSITLTTPTNSGLLVALGSGTAGNTATITSNGTFALSFDSGYSLVSSSDRQTWNGKGSVTSVAMTVPTGLSVTGTPITSSGTLAITFATGYSIPTTSKQSNWDTAYTNNHTHSNKSTLDGISSTDISSWNGAATNASTALSYFDSSGNAKSALKLTTVSKTAWGETYWTANGVPDTIKGTITDDYFEIKSSSTNPYIRFGNSSSDWKVQVRNSLLYFGSGTSTSLRINASGQVGVGGGITGSYKLQVTGTIYSDTGIVSAGYVTALSDIREKNVCGLVSLTSEDIAKTRAIQFTWKNENMTQDMQVGAVAQEWEKILPEVVRCNDGRLSLDYGVAALVSAIKLAGELVNLKRQIARLEKELSHKN